MKINVAATSLNLSLIRMEIEHLNALPEPLKCKIALQVLEELERDMAVDVADQELKLVRFNSPSHSWLRVPVAEIQRLRLEGRISRFSYVSNEHYYLETDSDMTKFLDARDRENRSVSDWESEEVAKFPHIAGIQRLDRLPGYVSMA